MIGTPLCHPEGKGEIKALVKLNKVNHSLALEHISNIFYKQDEQKSL